MVSSYFFSFFFSKSRVEHAEKPEGEIQRRKETQIYEEPKTMDGAKVL